MAVKSTMIAAWRAARKPVNFALWVILALALTIGGPFGTYETVDIGTRFVYWILVVPVSALIGFQVSYLVEMIWPSLPLVISDLMSSMGITIIFAPMAWLLTQAMLVAPGVEVPSLSEMAFYVFAVAMAVMTGRRLIPGIEKRNYLPRTHDSKRPRLLKRVPRLIDAQVIRITSQGHFVEIVSDAGTERIRMRLSDAVDEMDSVPGLLVHRSHWVAQEAIVASETVAGKAQLRLRNGDTVPVSRTYRGMLEEAGVA